MLTGQPVLSQLVGSRFSERPWLKKLKDGLERWLRVKNIHCSLEDLSLVPRSHAECLTVTLVPEGLTHSSNGVFIYVHTHTHTQRQTERETDRQTDRQTETRVKNKNLWQVKALATNPDDQSWSLGSPHGEN